MLFIVTLNTERLLSLVRLFDGNTRVQAELYSAKPRTRALELLGDIKERFTFATHIAETDEVIKKICGVLVSPARYIT